MPQNQEKIKVKKKSKSRKIKIKKKLKSRKKQNQEKNQNQEKPFCINFNLNVHIDKTWTWCCVWWPWLSDKSANKHCQWFLVHTYFYPKSSDRPKLYQLLLFLHTVIFWDYFNLVLQCDAMGNLILKCHLWEGGGGVTCNK